MGMEDLFGGGDQQTPIDILNTLLDPVDIEMKTDLNMTQIRVLCQVRWFKLVRDPANREKTATELLDELMTYAMTLMVSLKRESRKESIKGISEMKDKIMEQLSLLQMGGQQPR